jgi:predicted GIY-YIG superfamily endonuclease
MAWVYVLRGSSGRHYIGSTTDLERRLEQHRSGFCHSTHRLGETLELIASLQLNSPGAARDLERRMKRKKNPALALFLLEQQRSQPNG